MARLTNLQLDEFSIIRGDDVGPANPEATTRVYRSAKKEGAMAKQTATETPLKKNLVGAITDAVVGVLKGTRTIENESTYTTTSTSVTRETDGADSSVALSTDEEEEEKKKNTTDGEEQEEETEKLVTKALKAALNPITSAVEKFDSRLAAIEKQSTGSQTLRGTQPQEGGRVPTQKKFAKFEKFLEEQSIARGTLSPGQRLTKATITSGGWTYGLGMEEAQHFIDYIVDQSVLLKQVRTVTMPHLTYNLDKINLGGKVLKKATPGVDPGDTVSVTDPTQVQLTAKEVIAIVSVGDDTLEDNIEGEAFLQHLLGMIARSAANEIEQAAVHGDTAVSDTGILDRWNGWLKLAKAGGAHVTDALDDTDQYWPGVNGSKATKLLKSLPTKYRQDPRNLAWLLHPDLYLDYNEELASKGYSEAWMAITGIADVPLRGLKNIQVPLLKTDMAYTKPGEPPTNHTDGTAVILTDLRNLIFGIHREIRIEPFRQPRKRCTDYVLTMRADCQIENGDAIAIYENAKVKA